MTLAEHTYNVSVWFDIKIFLKNSWKNLKDTPGKSWIFEITKVCEPWMWHCSNYIQSVHHYRSVSILDIHSNFRCLHTRVICCSFEN